MPIFMDRHDVPGVTAKAVAEAHQEDLKIQDQFDCRGLTYWFDEEKGMAFCLIEAPSKDAVQNLHDYAHGLIPNKVIEVEPDLVEAFLGRIEDPEGVNHAVSIINDPAFRSIMAIYLDRKSRIASNTRAKETPNISEIFQKIVRDGLDQFNGREVEHSGECLMASFASVNQSVQCARSIQRRLNEKYDPDSSLDKIQVRIGLSAGVPVSEDEMLFGDTVKLARRLRYVTKPGHIVLGTTVHSLCNSKNLTEGEDNIVLTITPSDEAFLNTILDITDQMGCQAEFNVKKFARQAGMSKTQFYRKITSLTGLSPNEFIQAYRLEKSLALIEKQIGNISEIAYASGFNSLSYFSKCFKKRFGLLPSEYANSLA